jgi:hypothetical protein
MIYLKIADLQNVAQLCLKSVLKDVFKRLLCYAHNLIRTVYAIFVRRNSMYLSEDLRSPQITQKIGSANRKSPKCHAHLRKVRKFTELRFVELIFEPLTFANSQGHISSANEQAFQQVQAPKIPEIEG